MQIFSKLNEKFQREVGKRSFDFNVESTFLTLLGYYVLTVGSSVVWFSKGVLETTDLNFFFKTFTHKNHAKEIQKF